MSSKRVNGSLFLTGRAGGWGGASRDRTGRRFGGCWEEQGVPLRQGDYKTLPWPEMVREELTVAQGDGFPRAPRGKAGEGL